LAAFSFNTLIRQRRMALKIIKPRSDTRQVIARFEADPQTLF